MKTTRLLVFIALVAFPGIRLFSQDGTSVEWISTVDGNPWVKHTVGVEGNREFPEPVIIDPEKTVQTIDGFGGCFNELGWEALNSVSHAEKNDILQNLFNPVSGCKFNICRMPLGANDYAVDWYSFDETAGDYDMEHFSIARDRLRLIPYIKAAKQIRPDLQVWASPWSPPSWMKTNNYYACRTPEESQRMMEMMNQMRERPPAGERPEGEMPAMPRVQGNATENMFVMDDRTLSAYGLYFSRFIQEYKKEGIDIYAVHVQNEPNSCQNFPSCLWTPEGLNTLVKYVGKQFEKDGLETEIWLGTIERALPESVDPVLGDPEASKYITGVGFQWAGKGVIAHVNETYHELKLMQTETECGNGSNDWAAMEHTFSLLKHYFENGANSYMYWNMILDHTGKSSWGWTQNSMITITEDLQVEYNPEFYLMKHFSHFIEPSARFIDVAGDENCLAFLNPDNEVIVIYYNEKEEPVSKTFEVSGSKINVELQAKSLHTFMVKI